MKTNKLLFVLMIGLSSAITVNCSQQTITPAQKRQNIIDDAMKPENYRDLKQDLAFLESQGLLQPHSFLNLLEENITESDDATFNEVIEKAEDLLTEHMKGPFISTVERALKEKKPLTEYIDYITTHFGVLEIPLFTYVMQRKNRDMVLHNITGEWSLAWSRIEINNRCTPLYIASGKSHTDVVRLLLAAGANVDIQSADNVVSPLLIASCKGHTDVVRILLAAGANVDIKSTKNQDTSLKSVSQSVYIYIAKLLLGPGANIDSQFTNNIDSPLDIAVYQGYTDIVQILVEYGANVNIQNTDNGVSPLHIASCKGHTDVVRILLAAGANVDIKLTYNGITPLHIAVLCGHTEIVQLLVEHGANVNIQLGDNQITPLHIAVYQGYTDVVRLLLAAGANINIQLADNQITPLHIASNKGHIHIVKLLLNSGANTQIREINGLLAVDLARTYTIRHVLRWFGQSDNQCLLQSCSIS
ncbi:ankyrin repeat domain-containing protein [Candidatus Chromulinivorax destructor]|nr:ankyrin repeat domain-containing protein [Candidatus Chromulinivorax destructor]